jgi:hypothetical protein
MAPNRTCQLFVLIMMRSPFAVHFFTSAPQQHQRCRSPAYRKTRAKRLPIPQTFYFRDIRLSDYTATAYNHPAISLPILRPRSCPFLLSFSHPLVV